MRERVHARMRGEPSVRPSSGVLAHLPPSISLRDHAGWSGNVSLVGLMGHLCCGPPVEVLGDRAAGDIGHEDNFMELRRYDG